MDDRKTVDAKVPDQPESERRRHFLKVAGAGAAVAAAGIAKSAEAVTQHLDLASNSLRTAPDSAPAGYNILFILTDQERYFETSPFPVPCREAMRREGITFTRHQIASCVCSPSRSTIYTGQHTQHTGVLDNAGVLANRYVDGHPHGRPHDARRRLLCRVPRQMAPKREPS